MILKWQTYDYLFNFVEQNQLFIVLTFKFPIFVHNEKIHCIYFFYNFFGC